MKIATSYFYQIRNFLPNMIPVSTAMSDPLWYRPGLDEEYYLDKRNVVNGLRYEYLIVQNSEKAVCPCPLHEQRNGFQCDFLTRYKIALDQLDFDRIMKAFQYCADKFQKELGFKEEPIIVLMVYEVPSNPCSERIVLQKYFQEHGVNCQELTYPI